MKGFFKNPITTWFSRYVRARMLEYKNKKLTLGYMSYFRNATFGIYNTIYSHVELINVEVSDFTFIRDNTLIGNAKIGKFCSIGSNCHIGLGMHPSKQFISTHPIFYSVRNQSQISFAKKDSFKEFANILIGNDVWIGVNVVILDGVTIGDGAIIGAGAVVTKDIPSYAIVGGVPAKIIKYRFNEKEQNFLLNFKWWDKDIEWLKNNHEKMHNKSSIFFRDFQD